MVVSYLLQFECQVDGQFKKILILLKVVVVYAKRATLNIFINVFNQYL